ncbi:MAG: hypothetical protein HYY01_12860 [Chloroflexi bacterium]|nr:hypothetical protein [Chloroflexota bacterium]
MTEEQPLSGAGETATQTEPAQPEPPAQAAGPEAEVKLLQKQLALAVSSYRLALLARFPELPEELVAGDTVEAVDASLTAARGIVERVRVQLEARAAAERVPAGAPARSMADVGGLSPGEKIAYALSRGR